MSANLFEFLTILFMKHTFKFLCFLFRILEGTTNTAMRKSKKILFEKKNYKKLKLNITSLYTIISRLDDPSNPKFNTTTGQTVELGKPAREVSP